MEDYRLSQTGQEVQDILNGAAMQVDLNTEVERATEAEGRLQGNIDAEAQARQDADGLLQQGIDDEAQRAKDAEEANAGEIEGIKALIPSTASEGNKLADTNYVNSSIQTATAEYRGDYNVVTDLHLDIDATHAQIETLLPTVIAEADKNDYCYVMIPTSAQTPTEIAKIERYKMTSEGWKFEYDVNNSTFTAEEWAAIKSGITSGLVAKLNALPTNADLLLLLAGKQDVLTFDSVPVPESNNPVKSGGVYSAIDDEKTARLNSDTAIHTELDGLQAKVPATASSDNKLVDQNQMNTSISTATATFRGDWNVVSDLHLAVDATRAQIAALLPTVISTADNNDYCYVEIPTSAETPTQIERVERYKFNGTAWAFEYVLNNSGFTAAQWAAINSMITSGMVAKLMALPTNTDLLAMLAQKQNVLTFDSTPTENSTNPVTSGGVFAADKALSDAIEAILLLIPSAASSLNKLVDTSLMNSSISTATATFRGTYNLVSDLGLGIDATEGQIAAALLSAISTADNNDYAFVQIPTSAETPAQIARTDRYKFNGTAWAFEYTLNTSGFTAAQWAAINSTITSALVAKLNALPTAAELQEVLGTLTSGITAINQKIPSTASQSNKLVDNASMESYIAQVINILDASFNVTSTDGHITLHITQVDGVITSVQVQSTDIASAAALTILTGRVTTAEGNISANASAITTLQHLYNSLQQSAPQVIKPTDTWPVANPSTTVIYRVIDRVNTPPEYYSDYMWNGTSMVLMATYNNAIDDVPTAGSDNLVKSGGVAKALIPILSIDPSMDYVNYLIKDMGIDEYGRKNPNNTRSIIIVKLAENSSTITISTDVPLKTGNFYTGFPDIINGSNFISPRINPAHITETIIASAQYYIVMLDTSNRYPSYIRFSQEGNYASQAELLAVENNIGKVDVVTLMNRDCNIPASNYRIFYNFIPLTEDNVVTILITGYSGVIKAVRADYDTISELPFTDNVPFQMSLTTECAMFGFYTNGNIPAPSQINFHVKAVYNDLSGIVAYLEGLSDITKETADNFYKTDLIDVNGKITSGSFRYNGDVPSAKRPTNKTYGEIAFTSSANNLYLKFYGSSYSDIGYASVHLTSELKRVWIPANAAVFSVLTENNTPAVADINFKLNISYLSTDVLTAEECDNRFGDYENWSENNRYLPILYNLNRNPINTIYNQPYGENPSDTSTFRQLVLQIITDIHNEEVAAKSFLEFNKKYAGIIYNNKHLIDDMVGLGDYVNGGLEETLTIANFEGWHDILKAIGNHDSYENWRQHGSSVIVSEQVCYDTFMDGHIEDWGVVYQSGKTYFYKDYDAQKVRLVFLDYMHWDEENDADGQKVWLQNILYADPVNSALVKEYHVAIARHYICKSENSGSPVPLSDCSFVSLDRHSFDTEEITTECDIVNEFITRGGTFIAWLVGHRHFNWTGVYENYPNQIIIHQPCSAAFTYGRESSFPQNTDYINQFNLISFDTMYKRIKVYRVGAVYDRNMQHSESMILSYDDDDFGLIRCF